MIPDDDCRTQDELLLEAADQRNCAVALPLAVTASLAARDN
jgi:hypothetical protein